MNSLYFSASPISGEHRLEKISYAIGTHHSSNTGNTYLDFVFCFHISRDRSFYNNKVRA